MTHIIYLSLGSNLGDRLINLKNAISTLSPKVRVMAQSSVYETEPWGYSDQPAFLNTVVKGDTDLNPRELLAFLKTIEVSLGRRKTFRFGPRLIDLDILLFDDLVMDAPDLIIPHPRIAERAFVLVPLSEIAPDLSLPNSGTTIQQLRSSVDTNSVKLFHSNIS